MKKCLAILPLLLLAVVCSFAAPPQVYSSPMGGGPFGEGSIVFAIALPGPAPFKAYEFALCCGAPGSQGFLGNGFSYVGMPGGTFQSYYKSPTPGPCAQGCQFTGKFTVFYPNQSTDSYCSEYSGGMVGTLTVGTRVNANVPAEYSQMMCGSGGIYWSAFGGLTVHWQ